jgi:hypothetical protein
LPFSAGLGLDKATKVLTVTYGNTAGAGSTAVDITKESYLFDGNRVQVYLLACFLDEILNKHWIRRRLSNSSLVLVNFVPGSQHKILFVNFGFCKLI